MLNPSTATELVDDATIRRVSCFSRAWGFGSATVVNLFALRSRAPSGLDRHPDPVGPSNDVCIVSAVESAETVLVGWGNHGARLNPLTATPRHLEVARLLAHAAPPYCLGMTAQGQPRHPLYLGAATLPVLFSGAA